MWPFTKKRVYKITWAYGSSGERIEVYTEYFKAKDAASAWRKHRARRSLPTYCVSMEVVNDNGNNNFIS